jgi:hypothetical protein
MLTIFFIAMCYQEFSTNLTSHVKVTTTNRYKLAFYSKKVTVIQMHNLYL